MISSPRYIIQNLLRKLNSPLYNLISKMLFVYLYTYTQGRRDFLRGLNTHSNSTLKFYNKELFIYKCCYILYIFHKMNIKQWYNPAIILNNFSRFFRRQIFDNIINIDWICYFTFYWQNSQSLLVYQWSQIIFVDHEASQNAGPGPNALNLPSSGPAYINKCMFHEWK